MKNDSRNPQQQPEVLLLDANTPEGLFQADNGNKYVVTRADQVPIAIVLSHRVRPLFSWFELRLEPADHGLWLGRYELRLTHASRWGKLPNTPGHIAIMEGHLIMDCVGGEHGVQCIALGTDPAAASICCDYVGWSIRVENTGTVFFDRSPSNHPAVTVQPGLTT